MEKKMVFSIAAIISMALFVLPCLGNGPEMVFVEGGTFIQGDNDGLDRERPEHQVTVEDFYIGKYPVTQSEWVAIMDENPSVFEGRNLPAGMISWYDAVEFCNKLSESEGLTPVYNINRARLDPNNKNPNDDYQWTVTANWNADGYRLPTESEWEFAARGGNKSKGFTYAGSNKVDQVAWHEGNSNYRTHPVGKKKANELGIYDMSGNIWEWCWDWYGEYDAQPETNPRGPESGTRAVLRGGSFYYYDIYCRTAGRYRVQRGYANLYNGLRLVRNAQ